MEAGRQLRKGEGEIAERRMERGRAQSQNANQNVLSSCVIGSIFGAVPSEQPIDQSMQSADRLLFVSGLGNQAGHGVWSEPQRWGTPPCRLRGRLLQDKTVTVVKGTTKSLTPSTVVGSITLAKLSVLPGTLNYLRLNDQAWKKDVSPGAQLPGAGDFRIRCPNDSFYHAPYDMIMPTY